MARAKKAVPGSRLAGLGSGLLSSLVAAVGALPALYFSYRCSRSNGVYPRVDAGMFFRTSSEIHHVFTTQGFFEGLKTFYLSRSRPILHPALNSAAFFLSGGDAIWARILIGFFWGALFYFLAFRLLKKFTPPLFAVLGATLLSTMPWFFPDLYNVMSEGPMLVAVLGALNAYFYGTEKERAAPRLAFFAWLALAFCLRPIETLVLSALPLALFLREGARRRQLEARDFAAYALLLGWSVFCFLSVRLHLLRLALLATPTLAALMGLKKLKLDAFWFKRFAILNLVVSLWIAPFFRPLYEWAFTASWGDFTVRTGMRSGESAFQYLVRSYERLGSRSLLLLLVSAALCLGLDPKLRAVLRRDRVLIFSWLVFFPFLLSLFTYNGDPRYYQPSTLLLHLACLAAIGATKALPAMAAGTAASLALFAANLDHLASVTNPATCPKYEGTTAWTRWLVMPLDHECPKDVEEPWLKPLEEFKDLIPREARIAVLPLSLEGHALIFMPEPLDVIAHERGWELKQANTLEEADYFLVSPLEGKTVVDQHEPYELFTQKILDHRQKGELGKLGLKEIKSVEVTHPFAMKRMRVGLFKKTGIGAKP